MKKILFPLPLWQIIRPLPQTAAAFTRKSWQSLSDFWHNLVKRETTYLAPASNIKYNKAVWLVLMLFAWFLLDMILNYWQYLQSVFAGSIIIGVPILLLSLSVFAFLLYFLFNDVRGIVSLHQRQEIQREIYDLIQAKNVPALKKRLLSTVGADRACREKLEECWNHSAGINNIIDIYQQTVLAERDCKADMIILKYAALSGGANVVSSKAVLDFIITQMLYSKMVVEIAKTYGIRLGICSFLKLMSLGIVGAFFSGLITGIIEKFIHQMFAKITGEAVSSALIMAQLGFRIKFALRPVVPEKTQYLINNIRQILQDIKNNSDKHQSAV